jgi:hypothetical protein
VHALLTPEFAENQVGTLHFHYLLKVGGGVLQTSHSFADHHDQLVASLRRSERGAANVQFVREFIRPGGLDVPATPVFCDAVEELLRSPAPAPQATAFGFVVLRWAMYPVARLLLRIYGAELFRDDWRLADREYQRRLEARERERQERQRAAEKARHARERAIRLAHAERERVLDDKARRQQAKVREKAAHARRRARAAVSARLKQGAARWLARWRALA